MTDRKRAAVVQARRLWQWWRRPDLDEDAEHIEISSDVVRPRPASRRFVTFVALITIIGLGSVVLFLLVTRDDTARKFEQRRVTRDLERDADLAQIRAAQQKADAANAAAGAAIRAAVAGNQQLRAAACFIAEQPPARPRTAAETRRNTEFRIRAGCTPNPTDGR